MVNPSRSRSFANAIGTLAKTDAVDAKVLARFGLSAALRESVPLAENLMALRELVRTRAALITTITTITAMRNRMGATESITIKAILRKHIRSLTDDCQKLEQLALDLIKADAGLARRLLILDSIKGIGAVAALTLIANMPELGTLGAKAAGLLAGLAPIAADSGDRRGKRRIDAPPL